MVAPFLSEHCEDNRSSKLWGSRRYRDSIRPASNICHSYEQRRINITKGLR